MTAEPASPPGLRERKKAARATRVLNAAEELLAEAGSHDAVTLAQIARRADVAEMTVFNLVGNRAQIWAALAERALARIDPTADADMNPQVRARKLVDAVMAVIVGEGRLFRALMSSWTRTARVVSATPAGELAVCLADGIKQGLVVKDADVRRLAELLSVSLVGLVHHWTAELIDDKTLRTRAGDLVDLTFAAVRTGGPPELPGLLRH